MNIWKKLLTAVRGATNEIGEAVVDSQALCILDHEIRDANQHLERAKESLTRLMAEEMGFHRKVKQLQAKIKEHEGHAAKALSKGNEALALDVAKKIAEFSDELEAHQKLLEGYTSRESMLLTGSCL